MPETDLARPVVAWLREQRWDVYQEVGCGGSVADIVVTQGPLVGVVECKTTLGLAVLGQCHGWRRVANYVWAATPWRRNQQGFVGTVARDYGIGLISARELLDRNGPVTVVTETLAPALRRRIGSNLRDALRPEHASGIYADAGSIGGGGRYTPFAATCNELRRFVHGQPGVTLRDAIAAVRHHYHSTASAQSSLAHWIREGAVDGVELRAEERRLRLYPAAAKELSNVG